MLSVWSCSLCVLLLLSAVLGVEAGATHVDKRHRDLLHQVEKAQAQVTAYPKKRDATVCPSSYDLCPASLNGGCCPPPYGCATDGCYATTAGTQTACGMAGYYNCGVDAGGGCCPEGYICGTDNCTPPAGVSSVLTSCPASYYLCPASFDYGCCRSGYGCATNGCYVTTPFTTTYALTETATDAGGQTTTATLTVTTVRTPTPPTALPATSDSGTVAKFIPTSVEKTPATAPPSSNNSGGGGLSTAQLGGIIGGAIAILLVVVAAALIVIRRLNHVADVVETAKTTSSGDRSKSTRPPGRPGMAQYGPLSPSEIDGIGCDPLMMSTPGDGSAGTPQTLDVHRRHRSDSDYSQPAVTPSGHTLFDAPRHPNTGRGPSEAVYFDIPAPVHNVPRRSSTSHSVDYYGNGQQHGRQWSRASELSDGSSDGAQGVNIRFIPAELDNAGGFIPELPSADDISLADRGRRRSGSSTVGGSTIGSPRPSLNNNQRESSSSVVAGALPSPAVTGNQPLDPVNESGEFTHGYYGPWDGQPGQTAAGLDINYYITPPVALRFKNRA